MMNSMIIVVILLLGRVLQFKIPNHNLLFALVVIWSSYKDGLVSGMFGAGVAIVVTFFAWSVPGHFFVYSSDNIQRLVVVIVCMPLMAILVGLLKSRSDAQQKTLAAYLRVEKEKNGCLAEALSQKESPEGGLPVCAWCRRVRQEDGTWLNLEDCLYKHFGILITHGICPECAKSLLPDSKNKDD